MEAFLLHLIIHGCDKRSHGVNSSLWVKMVRCVWKEAMKEKYSEHSQQQATHFIPRVSPKFSDIWWNYLYI